MPVVITCNAFAKTRHDNTSERDEGMESVELSFRRIVYKSFGLLTELGGIRRNDNWAGDFWIFVGSFQYLMSESLSGWVGLYQRDPTYMYIRILHLSTVCTYVYVHVCIRMYIEYMYICILGDNRGWGT